MTNEFNSQLLALARKRRKLTARALAEKVGVSPVTITRLEKGENEPENSTVQAIAKALGFPEGFFYGTDIDEVSASGASFRSLSSMTARERDAALSAASIAYMFQDWVSDRFNLPVTQVPHRRADASPEVAARSLREEWGLGVQPIPNMVKLLEAKGVRVFSLCEDTTSVDAFSCWRGDIPYVFLNTYKSAERGRFDAAHELGHLVLHRHTMPQDSRQAENEADLFAACFLMPTEDVTSRIYRVMGLDELIIAKKRWGVSLAALVYRLYKLGVISEWQNRGLNIEMARRGYRKSEPEEMDRERSVVWPQILSELWSEGISKDRIARELQLPEQEINQLIFLLMGQELLASKRNQGLSLVS